MSRSTRASAPGILARSIGPAADRALVAAAVALGIAIVGPLSAGCSDSGPRRYRASGTVTFDGKPVQIGRIIFDPDQARGNAGPQGFAHIENGRYDTSRPYCKGSVGGPMVIRIDGLRLIDTEDGGAAGHQLFSTHEERFDVPKSHLRRDFVVPVPSGR